MEDALAPLEAALLLGITPELLFSYRRHAIRKTGTPPRKLQSIDVNGETAFRRGELSQFDAFLRAPWADPGEERPAIPAFVDQYLKVETGGQCARCGRGFPLKNAHIVPYASGRSHHHHNLIRLCAVCHDEFDTGIVPANEIERIKQELIARTRQRIEASLSYRLPRARVLPQPTRALLGRESELLELADELTQVRIISVQGPGGSGKTELLVHALARSVDSRQVVWFEVDSGMRPESLEVALRAALGRARSSLGQPTSELLDDFGGYVVFDGVEQAGSTNAEFERAIGPLIAATSHVRFLFTSQVNFLDLPIQRTLLLKRLPADASQAILCGSWKARSSSNAEQEAFVWIEDFAEGHALTLRVLNALLRHYESAKTVATRLRQQGSAAVSHPTAPRAERSNSLEKCLRTAYLALDEDAKRVMFIASLCPAGFFEGMLDHASFKLPDVGKAVASSRHWHLLEVLWEHDDSRRLRALSPIRSFIRGAFIQEWQQESLELTLSLTEMLAAHAVVMDYRYFHGGDVAVGVERFEEELPNLLYLFHEACGRSQSEPAYFDAIRQIAESLEVFYFLTESSQPVVEVLRSGLVAAIRTSHPTSAARMAAHLLVHAQRLGDVALAAEAMAGLRGLATQSAQSEVLAQHAMAEAMQAQAQSNYEDALKWSERALEALRPKQSNEESEPEDSTQLMAMALMSNGRALEGLRRFNDAIASYRASLVLLERVNDKVNPGTVLNQLGNCHAHLGHGAESLNSFLEAARLFLHMGATEHIGTALSEMGYLLLQYEAGVPLATKGLPVGALEFGAQDVVRTAKLTYLSQSTSLRVQRTQTALRRLVGLCVLATLTGNENIASEVCDSTRAEVVSALAAKLRESGVRSGPPRTDEELVVMLLDMTMAVGGTLANMVAADDRRPSMQALEVAALHSFPADTWPARHYPLLDWLAMYLRVRHGVQISAHHLDAACAKARRTGGQFELPDFRDSFST